MYLLWLSIADNLEGLSLHFKSKFTIITIAAVHLSICYKYTGPLPSLIFFSWIRATTVSSAFLNRRHLIKVLYLQLNIRELCFYIKYGETSF